MKKLPRENNSRIFFLFLIIFAAGVFFLSMRQRQTQQIVTPTSQPEVKLPFFVLPSNWTRVAPDSSLESSDKKTTNLEYAKVDESRKYPIGRITLQYSRTQELGLPEAIFPPTNETIQGIPFTVLGTTEADGQVGKFSALVYSGKSTNPSLYLRIFIRYQSEAERTEQKTILSTLQFTQ